VVTDSLVGHEVLLDCLDIDSRPLQSRPQFRLPAGTHLLVPEQAIDVLRITDDVRISVGQRTFQNAFVDESLEIAETRPVRSTATQILIQSREVVLRAVSTDLTT
jgi:hypothetical protein